MADVLAGEGKYDVDLMASLRTRYESAREFVTLNGQRRAVLVYFAGMVVSLVGIFPVAIWLLWQALKSFVPNSRPEV